MQQLANGVKEVGGRLVDDWGRELGYCSNPACGRRVKVGTAYCCGGCSAAHQMGAEAHKGGDILSYADSCNERHAERQKALERAVSK